MYNTNLAQYLKSCLLNMRNFQHNNQKTLQDFRIIIRSIISQLQQIVSPVEQAFLRYVNL